MPTADQLVQQALASLKRQDCETAKALLRDAAAQAPLRTDIRDLLVYAIEQGASATPADAPKVSAAPRKAAPPSRRRAGGWRLALAACGVLISVVLFCLATYIALDYWGVTPEGLPSVMNETVTEPDIEPVEPDATPDPMEAERRELLQQADVAIAEKDLELAVKRLERLLETDPPDPSEAEERLGLCHFRIGEAAFDERDYASASKAFRAATQAHHQGIDPNGAPYFYSLGLSLWYQGVKADSSKRRDFYLDAENALLKAESLDPEYTPVYSALANTCIKIHKTVEAIEYLRKIIEKAPDSPEADAARRDLRSMGATP